MTVEVVDAAKVPHAGIMHMPMLVIVPYSWIVILLLLLRSIVL